MYKEIINAMIDNAVIDYVEKHFEYHLGATVTEIECERSAAEEIYFRAWYEDNINECIFRGFVTPYGTMLVSMVEDDITTYLL